jgi:hypothetical protein
MAHLIAPIDLDGVPTCCHPATKRTEAILSHSAIELGPNHWEIYRADEPGAFRRGAVKFGVCCAQQVRITLRGVVETLNNGYDWIEVKHNEARAFYFESSKTSEDPDQTVEAGPFLVELYLEDRPCGHIIEILGSTNDNIANNQVWWEASLTLS